MQINESLSKNADTAAEYKMIKDHIERTYQRSEADGRFILCLLTKPSIFNLTGSFQKAKSILLRSKKNGSMSIRVAYNDFMCEYEQPNHMKKLSNLEVTANSYYIPHHVVHKLTSSTTKYEVVFNASVVDESGTSINDHLLIGPTLKPELFDVILKLCSYRVAFCADIQKCIEKY